MVQANESKIVNSKGEKDASNPIIRREDGNFPDVCAAGFPAPTIHPTPG